MATSAQTFYPAKELGDIPLDVAVVFFSVSPPSKASGFRSLCHMTDHRTKAPLWCSR
jgi:hypothetical protein